MSAYPIPLVPNQVEAAMQKLTVALLGLTGTAADSSVRIGWATSGQPDALITEDVTFVRCIEVDDPINRTRDVLTITNDTITVGQLTTHVRVWQTFWEISGPNSFDNARKIKSGMFTQALHDTFAALGLSLYLVTDLESPQRVPIFRDGQWWERVDFDARFNELVYENVIVPVVASAEVIVETSIGIVADVTVVSP